MAEVETKLKVDTTTLENRCGFGVADSEWEEIKEKLIEMEKNTGEISNLATACFGIAGSGAISIIPMASSNTNPIYLAIHGTATIFIALIGLIYLREGKREQYKEKVEIKNILKKMKRMEPTSKTKTTPNLIPS